MPTLQQDAQKRRAGVPWFKICVGFVVVAVIVLVVLFALSRHGSTNVSMLPDGTTLTMTCSGSEAIKIVKATYTPVSGKPVNVTAALQKAITALSSGPGNIINVDVDSVKYTANGVALGQTAGGKLSFRFKCVKVPTKSGFHPTPVSTCASQEHYTTQALSGRSEALQDLNRFEAPSFDDINDRTMNLMASVTRRSPAVAGGSLLSMTDIDSDFQTDGFYENTVLKETLTSNRSGAVNSLTAQGVGLGSRRPDPRFEPGPQSRVAHNDASPSHGGHAGGITLGGFGSSKFQTNGGWNWDNDSEAMFTH